MARNRRLPPNRSLMKQQRPPKTDPLLFRMKLLQAGDHEDSGFRRARSLAVLKAAAETYGWDPRPSPRPAGKVNILSGRGIAYSYRGETVVAQIAEGREVNRETGHVWAKRSRLRTRLGGFVVNPDGVRHTVECCGTLHGLSRALYEEVRFDTEKMTSRDWFSHPTLRHADMPESIEIILVNGDPHPNRPGSAPLRGGRSFVETDAQPLSPECDLRCHRRSHPKSSLPRNEPCVGRAEVRRRVSV